MLQLQHGGGHLVQGQHSPGQDREAKVKMEVKLEDQGSHQGGHDSYENGHFRGPGSHYPPPQSQSGQYPGQYHQGQQQQQQQQQQQGGGGEQQQQQQQYSSKCGRAGCRNYIAGHGDYCSSECVVGECKEVYDTWSSCLVKPGQGGQDRPNPDVMVK